MNRLIFLMILLFASCTAPPQNMVSTQYENQIYVTKKYVGTIDTIVNAQKYIKVYTDHAIIILKKNQIKELPDNGQRCYVKVSVDYLLNTNLLIDYAYFTWEGTDRLYRMYEYSK